MDLVDLELTIEIHHLWYRKSSRGDIAIAFYLTFTFLAGEY